MPRIHCPRTGSGWRPPAAAAQRTSLLQLLIDLIAIVTAGTITLVVQLMLVRRRDEKRAMGRPQG